MLTIKKDRWEHISADVSLISENNDLLHGAG